MAEFISIPYLCITIQIRGRELLPEVQQPSAARQLSQLFIGSRSLQLIPNTEEINAIWIAPPVIFGHFRDFIHMTVPFGIVVRKNQYNARGVFLQFGPIELPLDILKAASRRTDENLPRKSGIADLHLTEKAIGNVMIGLVFANHAQMPFLAIHTHSSNPSTSANCNGNVRLSSFMRCGGFVASSREIRWSLQISSEANAMIASTL